MGIQIISYSCHLKNRMGRMISSTIVRDALLDPDNTQLPMQALSEGLRNIQKGESREIFLRANDAYGFYDPKLVITRSIEEGEFKAPLKLDEQIMVIKDGKPTQMRVIQFSEDTVTLDGNHPLAGQDLVFEIQALEAREATKDEILEASLGQHLVH